jgi:translation elongation factor EF-Tu-like GTPase
MERKLFAVEDAFRIGGRGTIVAGSLEAGAPEPKAGDPIILVRPDGSRIETVIGGVETIKLLRPENFDARKIGILLENLRKEAVPAGTVVFKS